MVRMEEGPVAGGVAAAVGAQQTLTRSAGSAGPMNALSRSFRGMFQVPVMFWAIAMVVAAASAFVASFFESAWFTDALAARDPATIAIVIAVFAVAMLVIFLVLIPLGAATTRAALAVYHGTPVQFDMILAGFRRYGTVLGVSLLGGLPILIAVALGFGVPIAVLLLFGGPPGPLAYLGIVVGGLLLTILFFIPAFYVVLRWSFALFLVFDEERGAIDALGRSWHLTQDRVLTLFVIAIVVGVANAVAGVAPPLLVFTTGWAPLAVGEVYLEARSGRAAPVRDWQRETWADLVIVREDD